ncbi:hypothetical protein ACEU07_20960 [Chromobacterium violaceum]|uniref:hypothetical protein n=1 Tax=Chromobacterium violaceum TaxID=536 RepID=UPI0035A57E2B
MTKRKFYAIIVSLLFAGTVHAATDAAATIEQPVQDALQATGQHLIPYAQVANDEGEPVQPAQYELTFYERMKTRTVAGLVATSTEPLKVDITARNAADLARAEKWFQAELNRVKHDHVPVRETGWIEPSTENLKIVVRPAKSADIQQ